MFLPFIKWEPFIKWGDVLPSHDLQFHYVTPSSLSRFLEKMVACWLCSGIGMPQISTEDQIWLFESWPVISKQMVPDHWPSDSCLRWKWCLNPQPSEKWKLKLLWNSIVPQLEWLEWDGSAGKSTWSQAWLSEFNPQDHTVEKEPISH